MSARCSGLGATSAARFFVQLSRSSGSAPRPSAAAAVSAGPVLDVLLPRRPALRPLAAYARLRPPTTARRAAFSTTGACRRTVAVHNPQKDDEGRDMTMEITPRAAEVRFDVPSFFFFTSSCPSTPPPLRRNTKKHPPTDPESSTNSASPKS